MTHRSQREVFCLALTAMAMSGIFLTTSLLAADTLYVDGATGLDVGICTSELSPCGSIQYAVNRAVSGDVILVAAGSYTYDVGIDPCPSDHTAVVCIENMSLTIRGVHELLPPPMIQILSRAMSLLIYGDDAGF